MNLPELRNPFTNASLVTANMDPLVYHASIGGRRGEPDFIMSRSELMNFYSCPRKWINGYRRGDTDATEWGTLIDCLALSPKEFDSRFAIEPETYPDSETGESKKWNNNANFCKDWTKKQGARQIASAKDLHSAGLAIKRLLSDPYIGALVQCSKKQVMVMAEYVDKVTGLTIPFKTLQDLVPDEGDDEYGNELADLKTCRNAAPSAWTSAVFEHGLHIQAASYMDIYNALGGRPRNTFLHVLSENVPPFEPARGMLSAEFVEMGRATYIHALRFYCECLKSNQWPGYDDMAEERINGWTLIQPKAWMVMQ